MKRREREGTIPVKRVDGEVILLMLVCLIFDVTTIVLVGYAVAYLTDGWKGVAFLGAAGFFGLIGVVLTFGTRRYLLCYWLSMRKSAYYALTEDCLQRIARDGTVQDQLPYANMKRVRLKDGASMDGTPFHYIGIKIRKKQAAETTLDPYGYPWSREWGFDLVVHEGFVQGSVEPFYETLQTLQQAWNKPARSEEQAMQEAWSTPEPAGKARPARRPASAGGEGRRKQGPRPAESEEADEAEEARGARHWYKSPLMYLWALLGGAALAAVGWLLSVLLSRPDGPAAPGPAGQPLVKAGQQPQGPRQPIVPELPGLVAYWSFDEGQGTTARDRVGQDNATLHGGEWIPGAKGSALRLDGQRNYVDLGPSPRLNFGPGAAFTVAGWATTTANAGVICSFRRSTTGFPVINVAVQQGQLQGFVRDDTSGFGAAKVRGGAINDGQWHHFALVRQGDGMVELFLDGAFQAREKGKSSGGAITTDLRAVGSDRFLAQTGKAGTPNFAGAIDELYVFQRALDAKSIAALASRQQ